MTAPNIPDGRWERIVASSVLHFGSDDDERDVLSSRRHHQPIVAAFHRGHPIDVVVLRPSPSKPVGWAVYVDTADGPSNPFGAGCETETIDVARLRDAATTLTWHRLGVAVLDTCEASPIHLADLEDVLNASNEPMGWRIAAEPVSGDVAATFERDLAQQIAQGSNGTPAAQLTAARSQRLLELIHRERHAGLWRMQLEAGATDHGRAAALAAQLLSGPTLRGLDTVLTTSNDGIELVPSSVVAELARAPVVDVPGIRVHREPRWDLTPEIQGPIRVGAVVPPRSRARVGELSVPLSTINRHAFVTGATGSGKSTTVRRLLVQLSERGIPWLVLEPAKSEYQRMVALVDRPVSVIRIGDLESVVPTLNPLEPTSIETSDGRRTFNLAAHISLVRTLFEAAFDAEEPFPQILAMALERAYRSLGWNIATSERLGGGERTPIFPTLRELRLHALDVVDHLGYGREVRDNVRGFVDVRVNGLRLGAAGRFFEAGHPLDIERLITSNVVIQLEDLGNDRDQAFLIGAVLIRWVELLRLLGDSDGDLRHVIVIEEAHRLLRHTEGARALAIEQFANLLAEVRSYGQGVVVAEQIPSKLITDVIKNSALKIVHRLPAQDDRDTVGATMNLNRMQSTAVVSLAPGRAVVHADGMDGPIPVAVPEPREAGRRRPPAAPIVAVRSAGCSAQCSQGQLCSAHELDAALRLVDDPLFTCWVELGVVARLLGEPIPALKLEHAGRWKRTVATKRSLRCGLGEAVDRSVRSRIEHIDADYDPAALVAALPDQLIGAITDGASVPVDPQWQVAEFRWRDIYIALKDAEQRGEFDGPHPNTARWRRRVELPEAGLAEQISWIEVEQRRRQTPMTKLWGAPSLLAEACRRLGCDSVAALANDLGCGDRWVAIRYAARAEDEGHDHA